MGRSQASPHQYPPELQGHGFRVWRAQNLCTTRVRAAPFGPSEAVTLDGARSGVLGGASGACDGSMPAPAIKALVYYLRPFTSFFPATRTQPATQWQAMTDDTFTLPTIDDIF